MKKRIICLLTIMMIVTSCSSVLAHDKQEVHDKDLLYVLFGNTKHVFQDEEERLRFQHVADAAAICIDQFGDFKKEEFERLRKEFGFSYKFDDIALRYRKDGKRITADDHRMYTHRGWNFPEYPFPEKWEKRKSLLIATVQYELFGDNGGFFSWVPFIQTTSLGKEEQKRANSFSAIIYYVHLLGDYTDKEHKHYTASMAFLTPLVRHEDPRNPGLIKELITHIENVFDGNADKNKYSYPNFKSDLDSLQSKAEKLLREKGAFRESNFEEYKALAQEVFDTLSLELPKLLKNDPYFVKAFPSCK